MIKAILIDDEPTGLESLRFSIEKYCPNICIQGCYNIPQEGISGILHHKPDVVFLDVQMPQMSGFDVLQHVSPVTFEVIFVSAHDQYAIKAIKFSALDYLLKPIDVDDLTQAVNRINDPLHHGASLYKYQSVLNNVQLKTGKPGKLAVPTLNGIDFYNIDDVLYCKADGSYTILMLRNNQHVTVSKNLKDFESMLVDSGFCRVHHSFLINTSHVQKYIKGEGGYVILTDGHHVDISRRKKDEFLSLLAKY